MQYSLNADGNKFKSKERRIYIKRVREGTSQSRETGTDISHLVSGRSGSRLDNPSETKTHRKEISSDRKAEGAWDWTTGWSEDDALSHHARGSRFESVFGE